MVIINTDLEKLMIDSPSSGASNPIITCFPAEVQSSRKDPVRNVQILFNVRLDLGVRIKSFTLAEDADSTRMRY